MSYNNKQYFCNNSVKLAYLDYGIGEPILLIHGFASNAILNWVDTGWIALFVEGGYRIIALDNRGHGDSDKFYDISAYTPENMVNDAYSLLQHLNINKAHIMGYSMGARVAAYFALLHSETTQTLNVGGMASALVEGAGSWQPIHDAMLVDDINDIENQRGFLFRKFADNNKSDRKALAACIIGSKKELSKEQVQQIKTPTLVVAGEKDEISGSPDRLAEMMPNATAITLPRRNHMLAVGDKLYKESQLNFIKQYEI